MYLTEGTRIAEKYTIQARIGIGGMGEVYRARQDSLDRMVAVKFLKGFEKDSESYTRFKREAQILTTLRHKNLVACYEFGEWQGEPYMTMECVDGKDLHQVLRSEEGLEPERALNIAQQVASALGCAHEHGIIHRDLKPGNILLCTAHGGEELVKVIDFGLAKMFDQHGFTIARLTATGMAVGTAEYMSPEQCIGGKVDARSDVYSLGAVLFHMLTGRAPFTADVPVAVMMQHVHEAAPSITEARRVAEFPKGLDHLVARCLAKDPDDRYESAKELLEALRMVARNAGEKIPMFVPQISRTEPPKQEPAQRKKISVAWKGAMVVSVAAGCGIQLMMMAVLLNNNQKFVPIVTGPSSTNVVRPSEEEEANKVAREHFRRGDLAMEREDFGAAREQYFQAMQTVSKRDRQYASRSAMMRIIYIEARARADEGDYAAAEAKLLAARALRGNYNESHLDAVSVALRGKQFDTAKEYLKRALPMDSSNRFRELWHVAERNEGNSGPFSGGVDIYLRSLEERRNSDLPSVRDELKQLARKYPKSPTLLLHLYRMAQIYKEPKLLDLVGTANGG